MLSDGFQSKYLGNPNNSWKKITESPCKCIIDVFILMTWDYVSYLCNGEFKLETPNILIVDNLL